MKKKKVKRYIFCFLLICAVALVLTCRNWLPFMAKYLIVNDLPKKSDVIIVPSGSAQNLRVKYAVELYKKEYASKILFSGQLPLQKETGINVAKIYAMSLGVPDEDILTEENSGSTFENALFSRDIIQENGYKSVIIVTSPIHTRRTNKIFKEIFSKKIEVKTCCNQNDFDITNWWKNRNTTRDVVYEYFAFTWHFVFGT